MCDFFFFRQESKSGSVIPSWLEVEVSKEYFLWVYETIIRNELGPFYLLKFFTKGLCDKFLLEFHSGKYYLWETILLFKKFHNNLGTHFFYPISAWAAENHSVNYMIKYQGYTLSSILTETISDCSLFVIAALYILSLHL